MRWALLLLSACMTKHIGPGVILAPGWQEPRRDPDPTRPLVEQQPDNPWTPENGEAPAKNEDSTEYKRAYYAASAFAVVLGGFAPLLVWSGTLDENQIAPKYEPTPETPLRPETPPP